VISVPLKIPLKTILGICIYIISLPHRPDDYIGFASSCPPPHFIKKTVPKVALNGPLAGEDPGG